MQISKSHKSKGTIGIDIGPKEIAVAFVKNDGNPYVVYTPYMRTWKAKFQTIFALVLNTLSDLSG